MSQSKPKNIIRTSKQANPFVMIDHRPLNDPNLSWQAKGMLAYLLSKPDNWTIIVADLEKRATNGRDSVKSILKELETKGYIERRRVRDEKTGRFSHMETIVYELPQKHLIEPQAENPLVEDDTTNGFSVSGESTAGEPTAGESDPSNKDSNNNEQSKNERNKTRLDKGSGLVDDSSIDFSTNNDVDGKRLDAHFELYVERPPSKSEKRALRELAAKYGMDWVESAFVEYLVQNDLQGIKAPIRYIKGVLENWSVEGMRMTDVIAHLRRLPKKEADA